MRCVSMLAMILFSLAGPVHAQNPGADWTQAVESLLVERCLDCHSGAKPKGKLDLTSRTAAFKGGKSGPGIVPKNLEQSVLWQRVDAGDMPPKKPLSDKEKGILKTWIERGAVWGNDPIDPFRVTTSKRAGYDWWSLQLVQRPTLPNIKQKNWPSNPIDYFILEKLEAEGLTPSPQAEPRALIRRAYFDLTGLPPTPEDVDAFVKDQGSWDKVVDKLLASSHHGERWARHWLDVVRFAESHGFEHDELRKNAWPYRDWVIQAINRDMPYDEFARLQMAGDVMKSTDPSAVVATGFLVAGGYDSVGQVQQSAAMKAVVRQDELEDIVGTIGQTFLGLTVQCARCHDHKFDPVRTEEYYRLTAAVAGVRHGERDMSAAPFLLTQQKQQAEFRQQLEELQSLLAAIEKPVRAKILAERRKDGKQPTPVLPSAFARWDFTRGLKDEIAGLEVKLHGAVLKADGLYLDGKGYASTPPLGKPVKTKTLTALVRLQNVQQRGGAAISLQSLNGGLFDAIVFGEREPGRWMAGSEGFRRSRDFGAPLETESQSKPVHFAISYQADGTIAGYRNGIAYGNPYKMNGLQTFAANESMLLFGLRHSPPGGNKHLAGTLIRAELYDRALTPQEIAAGAGILTDYVADEEIASQLADSARIKHAALKRAMEEVNAKLAAVPTATRVYAVAPRTPEVTHLLIRGEPSQKGSLLTPGAVASLGVKADFGLSAEGSDAERRKKLAEWITDAKNPLFARVMVNRLWHYHFGAGLVETPSDFGFNGGRPSHPQLLDWLADEFVRSGYSMKHMHRLIITSSTYRQASRYRPEAAKLDASNRLLWRKSPLRLEAEAVRDSILAVAGQLNVVQGGPGYQDFKLTVRGATHYYTASDTDNSALYRRSIYRTLARSGRNGLLDVLDCPDPSTVSPRRAMTTTPLQALSLMNNTFMLRMADRFGKRVQKEAGDDVGKQIVRVYDLAYGRHPTQDEVQRVQPIVERHGLGIFCRAIFNSNEFIYVD